VIEIDVFAEIELETGWCLSMPLALVTKLGKAVNSLLIRISSRPFENLMEACGRWVAKSSVKSA
jgi:hypothetical protein